MRRGFLAVVAAAALVAGGVSQAAASDSPSARPVRSNIGLALFGGRIIDLSKGWSGAKACMVAPGRRTECFRSRAAMKARAKRIDGLQVSCSTSLDLYDTSSLGGSSISIYSRGVWVNLSLFGFDNRTSSYQVGACAIELSSGPNGGGNRYPRCLYAGCTENLMLSGWNNTISSAYLH